MDELLARHRKELRDLQSRITSAKKQASKKTRKQVNADCDALEAQIRVRHQHEVKTLSDPAAAAETLHEDTQAEDDDTTGRYVPPPSDSESESESPAPLPSPPPPTKSVAVPTAAKKPNRQAARLARRAAEVAAATEAATLEASALPNLRARELTAMAALRKTHGLAEHQVAPDGHCLYVAFAHCLRTAGVIEHRGSCTIVLYSLIPNAKTIRAVYIHVQPMHVPYQFVAYAAFTNAL